MAPPAGSKLVPERTPPLLLIAHGSRDQRSVAATVALRDAVAAAWPSLVVRHSFLELSSPRTGPAFADLATEGHREVVAAPLLLTAAYHSRVDVPEVLAGAPAGLAVRGTEVLGPDPRLLDALQRRLDEASIQVSGARRFDAVVLAAAGSSDPTAVASIERVAAKLGERYGVPARAGFASAATPVDEAVRALRATGAHRVAVASYFLAPGLLHDRVVAAAARTGAAFVADPLVDVPELVSVVLERYAAALGRHPSRAVA